MKRKIGIVIGGILLVALGFTIASIIIRPGKVVFYEDKNSGMTTFRPAAVAAGDDIPSLQAFNDAFVQIAESVTPSVVTITTEKVIKTNLRRDFPGFPDDDLFWRFFGFPQGEMRSRALGSGVIVDQKGYILTNNHVVERGEKISVKLIDNREFKAKIVGTDPLTDLAVIKIDAKDLQPAILGDSDALRVGEWVLAIGSPFSENLAHTVTAGIVSAKGRSGVINNTNYESFIQTDAAINPGNSGGALVNIRAELIGINTAIATAGMSQGNVGIGFAIPINLAKKVMTDLIEKGKVVRAWLGVVIGDVDENIAKSLGIESRQGAIISEVVKDSPAEKAGLKVGDVIKEFDGKKIKDSAHLRTLVSTSEVGKPKTLVVLR
ncbi:MAG TPA: trypsin-like peptidase domain-containing protein, partial [Candidatus Marinimicrobia bacterium]|nr:trypsin-like peptidase domain-containing protein [Candidatus Neomarinimicrobiota bacterium]